MTQEDRILFVMLRVRRATCTQVVALTGIKRDSANVVMRRLCERGTLRRAGVDRSARTYKPYIYELSRERTCRAA